MFKPFIAIVSASTLSLDISKEQTKYYLNGDYTIEANEFLKSKEQKSKDLNDIMYEIIAREIEEGKHDKK